MSRIAYLDNNATTMMSADVAAEMRKWMNCGNPSASYPSACSAKKMMDEFKSALRTYVDAKNYKVFFTSGATEANCTLIRNYIDHAMEGSAGTDGTHIVCSAIEHKSIITMLEDMVARFGGRLRVSLVGATLGGHVPAAEILRAIMPNTFLVICMHANNETGAINDVRAIGAGIEEVRKLRDGSLPIYFHSDVVQSFGKIPLSLRESQIGSAAVSFHKLHGPPGVGIAFIRDDIPFHPLLYGSQNDGLRGGTENPIGIGAAAVATSSVFANMHTIMKHESELKKHMIASLKAKAPCMSHEEYMAMRARNAKDPAHNPCLELVIVLFGDTSDRYLPNTLLLAAAKHVGPAACNKLIKEKLASSGVIVSVGSACNTSSSGHSHVLRSMHAEPVVMDGTIRVSICRYTTREEIDRFVNGFIAEVLRQYETVRAPKKTKK